MITTGSKYLFGVAAFALAAALVYGVASAGQEIGMDSLIGVLTLGYKGRVGDHYGYSLLVGLFGASLFLGCAIAAFRDADPEAEARLLELDTVPDAVAPQGPSYWPIIGAFGLGTLTVGVVVGAPLVIVGAAILAVTAFEWAAKAWSERATGDPAVNRAIRNRVLYPIEIPLFGVVGIATFVLAVSRVLIALPSAGAYVVFGSVPAIILLVGWLVSARPTINRSVLTVALLLGGVAVLVGGVVGAAVGPREIEKEPDVPATRQGSIGVIDPGAPVVVGHRA